MWRLPTICVVIISGCASHTGVVDIGQGRFMASKQQATGFPGLGNMKAELIGEGKNHCASIGMDFEILGTQETQPPYILGNYPRSEIVFRCVRKNTQSGAYL